MEEKTGYSLSRAWFDFSFENPEKVKPNHTALYFFAIEHCNRLGWKEKFGLPTTMAREAIGIKSYNTYINTLNDLVEWKFITMIEVSKNQYSSNIIALSNFNKALNKALDKALIRHGSKHQESTGQSTGSIVKPETNKPETNEPEDPPKKFKKPNSEELKNFFIEKGLNAREAAAKAKAFILHYNSNGWKIGGKGPMKSWKAAAGGVWLQEKNYNSNGKLPQNVPEKSNYGESY